MIWQRNPQTVRFNSDLNIVLCSKTEHIRLNASNIATFLGSGLVLTNSRFSSVETVLMEINENEANKVTTFTLHVVCLIKRH